MVTLTSEEAEVLHLVLIVMGNIGWLAVYAIFKQRWTEKEHLIAIAAARQRSMDILMRNMGGRIGR